MKTIIVLSYSKLNHALCYKTNDLCCYCLYGELQYY